MQGRFRRLCCLATGYSGASADVSYRGAIGEGRAKSNHRGEKHHSQTRLAEVHVRFRFCVCRNRPLRD
jgi:hypothetical protein